jgi:16S rRNA (guanine527-N7)-methyltransferase
MAVELPVSLAHALAHDRARALDLTPVSRETAERLGRMVDTLLRWQRLTNLVAPSSLRVLWTRHIADSLQLLALIAAARTVVDLGSGAGFPGLVLACALAERPGAVVHLVESNGRKAAFLREAARAAGAPAVVHQRRIEAFVRTFETPVDVVTARALAPLPELVAMAAPLLERGAQAVFPKGREVEAELTETAKAWMITVSIHPSRTDPQGRIVCIHAAQRRQPA